MAEATEPIVRVQDVAFAYQGTETRALQGVNLEIGRGEFVALIGQNGAGKTTLAKLFNGLLLPTSGRVVVDGQDTRQAGLDGLARVVGYCYQNPDHQIFARTVREEVAFGPRNLGMSSRLVNKAVNEALALVGMEELAASPPYVLGRGQRQKLAVASIIAMGSEVLLVDEPTTGLDLRGALGLMDLLREWNSGGRTIFIITHDMKIVAEYAQRAVVLSKGRIIADGPTREILSDQATLARAFLKAPQMIRVAQALDSRLDIARDTLTVAEMLDQILKKTSHTSGQRL